MAKELQRAPPLLILKYEVPHESLAVDRQKWDRGFCRGPLRECYFLLIKCDHLNNFIVFLSCFNSFNLLCNVVTGPKNRIQAEALAMGGDMTF